MEHKIKTAVVQLMLRSPFISTLLLSMELVQTDDLPYLAATDGTRILVNSQASASLSLEQLVSLLAHEVLHVAFLHPLRMQNRDPDLWNVACDYAVNWLLHTSKFALPEGALLDASFADLSAEEIYARLSDAASSSSGKGKPSEGLKTAGAISGPQKGTQSRKTSQKGPRPGTPQSYGAVLQPVGENVQQLEADLISKIVQAAQAAKAAGKLPLGIDRYVEGLLEPKVSWKQLLRRFVTEAVGRQVQTWVPPNRRLIHLGHYLPGWMGTPHVVVAIDTSGSISNKELSAFEAELVSLVEELDARTTVIYCDAAIQGVQEFMPGEPIQLRAKGGGGTVFTPVFEYIASAIPDCRVLIYMTDLEGTFPEAPPPYPVIWVSTHRRTAPFGTVVYMDT